MLWASKVREQISKRPPGSSILGSQTVLSISSAKRSYNVEMRRRTFNQGHGNFWLRWPLLVSLARCGGMFTICTLMIKGTCIILVKMWEIERKKKNALQMYKAKASKVLLLMFLSDLARVNNASSFKDEVSSTDLLLFSFSLVLIPSFFFKQNTYVFTHTLETKWITESIFETQIERHLKKRKLKMLEAILHQANECVDDADVPQWCFLLFSLIIQSFQNTCSFRTQMRSSLWISPPPPPASSTQYFHLVRMWMTQMFYMCDMWLWTMSAPFSQDIIQRLRSKTTIEWNQVYKVKR